jgi:hypothetical protein
MPLNTYGHVMEELDTDERHSAEDIINAVRDDWQPVP